MPRSALFVAALVLVAVSTVEADPEVTDKVFFDIEIGGKPAGAVHAPPPASYPPAKRFRASGCGLQARS